jgi:hypothetical protein
MMWELVQMNRNLGRDHWEKKMNIETLMQWNRIGASREINENGLAM